jgi:hypothetical protein
MSRLDTEKSFAVEVDEAEQFFPRSEAPSTKKLRDYRDRVGHSMVRADTLRRLHPDHEAVRPLQGKIVDLLDRLTHPAVLDARDAAEEVRAELEDCPGSDLQRLARLKSSLSDALDNVEEQRKQIEEIEARIDDGKTLDARQLSILLDREIDPKTETLSTLDGETLHADTSYALGMMHEDFGSSAQWSPTASRRLYRDLLRRLLRERARKVEDKPRERSVSQHVAEIGVERLVDADPRFDCEPTTLFVSNRRNGGKSAPPKPRKRGIPSKIGSS